MNINEMVQREFIGAIEDDEVARVVHRSFCVRNETLNRCYAIDGYADLPANEKCAVYDEMLERVREER